MIRPPIISKHFQYWPVQFPLQSDTCPAKIHLIAQTLDHFWFQNTVLTCVWALFISYFMFCMYVQEMIMAKCSYMTPPDTHWHSNIHSSKLHRNIATLSHSRNISPNNKCCQDRQLSEQWAFLILLHAYASARNKDQKLVSCLWDKISYKLLISVQLKMYRKFGWPNAEIGWKLANDWLLFLALHLLTACMLVQSCLSLILSSFWKAFCVR